MYKPHFFFLQNWSQNQGCGLSTDTSVFERWQQLLCRCSETTIVCPCLFLAIQLYCCPKQEVWTGFWFFFRSWKTRKVLEFYCGIFQPKSPWKRLLVLERYENLLNSRSKKKSKTKSISQQCWDLGLMWIFEFGKSIRVLEKSWKMVSENRYKQCVNDYIASVIQLHAYVYM